jgi:long-chain acyl-CoA synthetase
VTGDTGGVTSMAVALEKRPRSLVHLFLERAETTPEDDAYYYPVEGGWQESTWAHTRELVEGLAAGLVALGIQPEDRVALVVGSRYEWVLGYLSALWAGGAVTALDPRADEQSIARVIADSGARLVIADDYETVHMLWRIRADIRAVTKVVQVDGDYPDQRVLSLEGLLRLGHDHLAEHPRALSERLYALRRDGLAALVYSRDDAGTLRGVRLTHSALTYAATALAMLGPVGPDDVVYLPVALTTSYGQTVLGAQLACGFRLAIEARPEDAVESLRLVRPTVVTATASLLQQVRAQAERDGGEGRLARRRVERAFAVAGEVAESRARGDEVGGRLARRRRAADRKVFAAIRGLFGDRLRYVVVAGGGVDAELSDYADRVGLTVVEAYGRAEAGPVSVALPDEAASRTAGRPLPGTEVAIADDGEILVRGPGLAQGYHAARGGPVPLLERGWLHTGDSGVLDDEGRLRVLGRLVRRSG